MGIFDSRIHWPDTYWMRGKFDEGDVEIEDGYAYNAVVRIEKVEGLNIVERVIVDEFTVYEDGQEIGGLKSQLMYHEFLDWVKADGGNHKNWELQVIEH
jgi:hypothetical protein